MGQSLLPEHVDIVATEKVALAVEVNAELRLLQGTGMLRRVGGRLRTGHTPRPRLTVEQNISLRKATAKQGDLAGDLLRRHVCRLFADHQFRLCAAGWRRGAELDRQSLDSTQFVAVDSADVEVPAASSEWFTTHILTTPRLEPLALILRPPGAPPRSRLYAFRSYPQSDAHGPDHHREPNCY